MKLNFILILFVISICGWGCNIINPPEAVPTYIHVDSFTFNNPPAAAAKDGTSSHAIGTIWVYYNGKDVGVFDLPATFPVIASGTAQLQISAGISQNGISDYQTIYPFYASDTFSFAAQPGKVITHEPTTQYYSSAIFPIALQNNFNVAKNFFTYLSGDTMAFTNPIHSPDSMVFEGGGSCYMALARPGDSSEYTIADGSQITIPAGAAFMELNFKNSMPFAIGMIAYPGGIATSPYYVGGVNSSTTYSNSWQKIYIDLSSFVGAYPSTGNMYSFTIKAMQPANQPTGYILLDNLKVITF